MESKKKQKIAVGIADPEEDPDLFGEEWQDALTSEKGGVSDDYVPAGQKEDLIDMQDDDAADLVEKLKIGDDAEDEEEEFVEPQSGVLPQTNGTAKTSDTQPTSPLLDEQEDEKEEEEDLLA